jgi:hypothetical protein
MSLFLKRLFLGFVCFVLVVGASREVRAQEGPFKLKVSMNFNEAEPLDKTFKVRAGSPKTFYVIITNISSSAQPYYGQSEDTGYSSISFEITDEGGNTNVIRRKRSASVSGAVTSTYLKPGEKQVFDILLNDEEWDNCFKLYKEGAKRARVRAIYDNESKTVYSPYYDVILVEGSGIPTKADREKEEKEKEEKASSSSVLVSK